MPRPLSPTFAVAAQITAQDVAILKDMGFKTIINNRPDDEEASQPTAAQIEKAATGQGLAYAHIPVTTYLSEDNISATHAALQNLPTPILAYCRSGTRSTYLWQAALQYADTLTDIAS